MFQAAKHRRAALSHKDPGAGAVVASNRHCVNHDSLDSWPCVFLLATSFFCLEGATSPAKHCQAAVGPCVEFHRLPLLVFV